MKGKGSATKAILLMLQMLLMLLMLLFRLQCSKIHGLNSNFSSCNFIKCVDGCASDGSLLDYLQFIYCTMPSKLIPLAMILLVGETSNGGDMLIPILFVFSVFLADLSVYLPWSYS